MQPRLPTLLQVNNPMCQWAPSKAPRPPPATCPPSWPHHPGHWFLRDPDCWRCQGQPCRWRILTMVNVAVCLPPHWCTSNALLFSLSISLVCRFFRFSGCRFLWFVDVSAGPPQENATWSPQVWRAVVKKALAWTRCVAWWLGSKRYVKSVFIVHVGCTRCVTFSTANNMKIHVRITLTVECIRTRIFLFLFYVWIQ